DAADLLGGLVDDALRPQRAVHAIERGVHRRLVVEERRAALGPTDLHRLSTSAVRAAASNVATAKVSVVSCASVKWAWRAASWASVKPRTSSMYCSAKSTAVCSAGVSVPAAAAGMARPVMSDSIRSRQRSRISGATSPA